MGAQSYPGAVWAPVTLSRRIGNSPRNPELFAQSWFFFSQSRPGAPPCHIGSQVWFLNRRPTHFPAGEFGKRESRESSPKNGDSKRGRIFPRARYRESGLGQRVVPRLFFRATRGQEKATLWRLPDLAVNFQVLHTCARGRRAEGAASTRRPVLFGAANPNGRVGNGAGTRRGAPFRERAKRARRRAARRHRRASRRLFFRNRVTSLGGARRWRALRPRTCTCCSWTTTGCVVPSSRACSRSATTRVSPESRPERARVIARRREEPRDVTAIGRRGFSTAVDLPPARAPERRSD